MTGADTMRMSKAAWVAEGYARRVRLKTVAYEKADAEYRAVLPFVYRMMAAVDSEVAKVEGASGDAGDPSPDA